MEPFSPDARAARRIAGLFIVAGSLAAGVRVHAATPWPAESNAAATKLTLIDAGLGVANWSGASWNPATRTLWLACNSGYFWALVEDGTGSFRVARNAADTPAKWSPGGDLESICQADLDAPVVYALDENGWIREYDISQFGVVVEIRNWDIRAQCPEVGGTTGPEGLTFVPDAWLQRERFSAASGDLCVSTNGMGGLMFVGHQDGGYVHVFDLALTSGQFGYVGRYKTSQPETAGLEFDRETGKLYLWHNTGSNYLEVAELGSYVDGAERRFRTLIEYTGPRSGNLEGFAMLPTAETNNWCFVTDDNNDGGEAVVWYRQFAPSEDTDADALPDAWELLHFGSTIQTAGTVDSDLDGVNNAAEYVAGTDPTNHLSTFTLTTTEERSPWVVSWRSESNRLYAIEHATALAAGFTQLVESALEATPPVNSTTVSVSGVASGGFYRVSATAP